MGKFWHDLNSQSLIFRVKLIFYIWKLKYIKYYIKLDVINLFIE